VWPDGFGITANCTAIKEFSTRQVKLYTCVKTQKLNYNLTNFCPNDNGFFFFFPDNLQIGFTANQETFPFLPATTVRSSGGLITLLLCVT
jgi:hypothetical protein